MTQGQGKNVHSAVPWTQDSGDKSMPFWLTLAVIFCRYISRQVLWSKGIDILLGLMRHHQGDREGGVEGEHKVDKDDPFPITIFGSGSDLDEVRVACSCRGETREEGGQT